MIRVNSQSFSLSSTLRKKSHDERQQTSNTHTVPKSLSFPIQSKHQQFSDELRLHYVTQRILASVLPRRNANDPAVQRPHTQEQGGLQDKYEEELILMLEQKHGKNYRVFDLESCISVITLERICELCKHIDAWLGGGQEKVVVLQDRGDRQRLGTAIAAYLEYLNICASNYSTRNGIVSEDIRAQNTIARNWVDLDIFSMRKFLEDFIGPLREPSHKRYLKYFSGLLSGKIRMNSAPLHLRYLTFESLPSWLQYDRMSAQNSEWNSFIKIYEGLRCVYTSDIHIIPITTRQFLYHIGNLRLRGDIIVRCYQVIEEESSFNRGKRELLFSVQFHTCAITTNDVSFVREDLDLACDDPRFPSDHKITLYFDSKSANNLENDLLFQSPLIRTEPCGDIAKYDSLENISMNSAYHTQGPVDGSLYATISKAPKSPPVRTHYHSTGRLESQPQNLISPPPQFSNKRYDTVERTTVNQVANRPTLNSGTLRGTSRSTDHYPDNRPGTSQSSYREKKYDPGRQQITIVETYTTTDGSANTTNQNGTRDSVRSPLTLSMDSGISSSGLLNRRQQGSSVSPSSLPSQASPQEDRHRELDDILSDMLMTVQDIPDFNKSSKQTTHRIVRSQSVIPTPNQSFISAQQQHAHTLRAGSVSGAHPNTNGHHQTISGYTHHFAPDPVKRSQSYTLNQAAVNALGNGISGSSYFVAKDRDVYDTSSTTTTLTPPPSESGRDTPIGVYGGTDIGNSIGNVSTVAVETRHITTTTNSANAPSSSTSQRNIQQHYHQPTAIQQREMIVYKQQQQPQAQPQLQNHQSSIYSRQIRTEDSVVSGTSEDEENIPYHAREHSQPFTYGNVPPIVNASNGHYSDSCVDDPERMIKIQSGLSSPSLVRKTLGGSQTTLRKTSPRNDFEDMLRERREKVMSEKYSIGDKLSGSGKSYDRSCSCDRNKWMNTTTTTTTSSSSADHGQPNGYHYYHEPLKRSNTLDGGFGRSNSTDGISGQTWLQLQQQKLRAKKEQQIKDDRRYFEETIHTEIRNRPLRSRANVSQRYDGYASDTAAFADEVDYRKPLHIQTPYNANRASERNYHTLTTTSTVTQKERPFVAVKRAHEYGKHDGVRSPPMSPLSVLNSSPNGHIAQVQAHAQPQPQPQPQPQNGLLSMADSARNGHVRLESENNVNGQDECNKTTACTNVNDISNHRNNNQNNMIQSTGIYHQTINDHDHHTTDQYSQHQTYNHHDNINNNQINYNRNSDYNNVIINNSNNSNNHNHSHNVNNKINMNTHNNHNYENLNHNNNTENCNTIQSNSNSIKQINITNTRNNDCPNNTSIIACGQLVLDNLLASLAYESDIINQQLSQTNANGYENGKGNENGSPNTNQNDIRNKNVNGSNFIDGNDKQIGNTNNTNPMRIDHVTRNQDSASPSESWVKLRTNEGNRFVFPEDNTSNLNDPLGAISKRSVSCNAPRCTNSIDSNNIKVANPELSEVLADLTEFTRFESMRQMSINGGGRSDDASVHSQNHSNNNSHTNSHYSSNNTPNGRHLSSETENSSSISPSISERSNAMLWHDQVREESFSSYRSETEPELSLAGSPRPETPAFPVTPRTPYGLTNGSVSPALPPKSPTSQRKDLYSGTQKGHLHEVINQNDAISCYTSRRNSNVSNANSEPQEVAAHHVKFVKDSSKYWYKPNISREDTVALLRNAMPGTFIVRDSTTFKNAFGLVLRVAHPPPGVTQKSPNGDELVRHFLVEPTSRGVRLKGCANEPVFTSLSALVYQHSVTPLALPCRLTIPDRDIQPMELHSPAQKQLLAQGAACNVLYLFACETESLTGEEAVRKAVSQLYSMKPLPVATEVHFKVSHQGITLTDVSRQKFFRKHYASNVVSYCGSDPEKRVWTIQSSGGDIDNKTIFAFVARRSASSKDNQCHVFCDLTPTQPATAIISFANKVLPTDKVVINQHI